VFSFVVRIEPIFLLEVVTEKMIDCKERLTHALADPTSRLHGAEHRRRLDSYFVKNLPTKEHLLHASLVALDFVADFTGHLLPLQGDVRVAWLPDCRLFLLSLRCLVYPLSVSYD